MKQNIFSKITFKNYPYILENLLPMNSVEYGYCTNCGWYTSYEKGSLFGVDYTYESCCFKLELNIETEEELHIFLKQLCENKIINIDDLKSRLEEL